jgi:threonyl-tRNA synthetase
VQIIDHLGRESTISTIQLDFHQPEQFDLSYVDSSGAKQRPVMVHRSLVGSMERLFAYLIEEHGGAFPVWYAPVQIAAVPISNAQDEVAAAFVRQCVEAGLRAEPSYEGSLGARVRESVGRKIPYVAVIGPREAAAGEVALRLRDGRQLPSMPAPDAVRMVSEIAASRSHDLVPEAPVD